MARIRVRAARPVDREPVVAFCQNTFGWGDYISDAWDRWLADTHGELLVAVLGSNPVGLIHWTRLDGRVAWMEGMRVHPDHRRSGIGTALNRAALGAARRKGCETARLATAEDNLPAQKTLDAEAYGRVAHFASWKAESEAGDWSRTRVARLGDQAVLLAVWSESPIRQASRGLVMDRRWHWRELTAARLDDEIGSAQVRVSGGGFSFLSSFYDEGSLNLHALVGAEDDLETMARTARAEAAQRGFAHVDAMVAHHASADRALERAGYRREGGMYIYERALE